MAFDWEGHIRIAGTLASQTYEAAWRSSISRAYYAVFNQAAAACLANGCPSTDGANSHNAVWNYLDEESARWGSHAKHAKKLSQTGKRLKLKRTEADYRAHARVAAQDAQSALLQATNALAELKRLTEPAP